MPNRDSFALSFPQADIAVVTFDTPGTRINLLTLETLKTLEEILGELEDRSVAGMIFQSAKPQHFIAGTDLKALSRRLKSSRADTLGRCKRGRMALSRLSSSPFVTVAAVDGTCLGAGAELALWCDCRVLTDSPATEIGWPEVKLGLIPGWGGTVRLPRIVGLGNAVDLITTGHSVDASKAAALGLADDVVPEEQLIEAAIRVIRHGVAEKKYVKLRQTRSGPLGISAEEVEFLRDISGQAIRERTGGRYPAAERALEVLTRAAHADQSKAGQLEAEAFAALFGSPANRALINVFFLAESCKREPGGQDEAINSVGVLGAGIMGQSVAAATIKSGLPVLLADASQDVLREAIPATVRESTYDPKTGENAARKAAEHAALLAAASSVDQLATCELVIESIVENLEVKRQVFRRLEPKLSERSVLASNTSTIPITGLAESLESPGRMCGLHFFNPVKKMRLVEVVRAPQTAERTIATAVAFVKRIGKLPLVVNDGPGFLVNRLLMPYLNEAFELLSEGVDMHEVDTAAVDFGMPMGPLALCDMIGLDTSLHAGRYMWEAFPDRVHPSPILPAMVKRNRLGWKSGAGFFSYGDDPASPQRDTAAEEIIRNYIRNPRRLTRQQIQHRLFLPMLLEATRAMADGIVASPREVDTGLIFGLGFPRFRGGLMFWADTVGPQQITEWLKPWESLGSRMQPTEMLLEIAQSRSRFYGE